ncbi:hypothetical protein ACXYTC_24125, partial [Escherichia coli]
WLPVPNSRGHALRLVQPARLRAALARARPLPDVLLRMVLAGDNRGAPELPGNARDAFSASLERPPMNFDACFDKLLGHEGG